MHNEQEWKQFASQTLGLIDAPPRVDFTQSVVVAIFAGERRTGGYSVRIDRVTNDTSPGGPARATVHYSVTRPPRGAAVIQAFTYPFAMVRLNGKFERVDFDPPISTIE